jgi:cobalt-zinc-cadmium efflux system outer membrane protein
MQKMTVWGRHLFGCLLLGITASAGASDVSPALQQLMQGFLERHPAAQAARADLERTEAEARAAGQPLYNPEVEFDYEDATDITKTVGLAQTFDWSGKRRARNSAAQDRIRAAYATLSATRQEMLGELLGELSQMLTTADGARLAARRVTLLEEFLRLAEQRFAAGDVSRTDVDLAQLALSEAQMQAAAASADATATEARLKALVERPASGWPVLPVLPKDLGDQDADVLLQQHPVLQQQRAEAAAARASVNIANRDRRPDPTIAVRGGKEASDDLVGVTVSIPLYIRNTFRAELDAANAEAISAEQHYRNTLRRARSAMQAAVQRYRVTRSALAYWEQTGLSSLQGRVETLRRLWQSGEINTTDYLVQLQQTLDTRISAVELRRATWDAWLAWLQASGTTEQWLGLSKAPASN